MFWDEPAMQLSIQIHKEETQFYFSLEQLKFLPLLGFTIETDPSTVKTCILAPPCDQAYSGFHAL